MIKVARKRLNLTQKELALRCNMSQSYISKLENKAYCNITLNKIKRISKALNINQIELAIWLLKKDVYNEYTATLFYINKKT